jgi:type I restriction enzyme R subunit
MPTPGEHKTVQARILAYAKEVGWAVVPREEAERRRGFNAEATGSERARGASLYFEDLLDAQVRRFNPRYTEAAGALPGKLHFLHTDIYGNRDFLHYLRNQGKFFDHEEDRERDLVLIDYSLKGGPGGPPSTGITGGPGGPPSNIYEVTEEWTTHNGHHATRQDVVFLINGIPVLVIECKNATKDEGIALGIDQLRRYHRETPEVMVPQQLFTATDAIGFKYGVTWNMVHRNIFSWKHADVASWRPR